MNSVKPLFEFFLGRGNVTDHIIRKTAHWSLSLQYLGYYDAESCYTYKNAPTETPVAPQTIADFKRFVRSGAATNRMCNNAFSGNFLNWASNSAIDMLRLSLTGGDRYIDTDSLTRDPAACRDPEWRSDMHVEQFQLPGQAVAS